MNFLETITQWMNENPGKAAGSIAGIVFGFLIIAFGPLKAFFVVILAAIGYMAGKLRDDNVSIAEQLRRLFGRGRGQ
jgi:uncharacterized membrane protein